MLKQQWQRTIERGIGGWWFISLVFVFFAFVLSSFLAQKVNSASAPLVITYQGKVLESGTSVTTTKTMGFLIYDAVTGGNLIYTASGTLSSTSTMSVTPSQGIFSVTLGAGETNGLPTSTFANNTGLFLEVWISGTKMTPRKQLTAAPFAINSELLMGLSASSTSSTTYIPHSDSVGNFKFTGTPQASGVGGGVIYVNPGSADADETLFGVAVNGFERFRVDEDGDVWMSGAVFTTSSLMVLGGTNLATTTITSTLDVDSGVLYADGINNRVGVNSSTPFTGFGVVGNSYFSGTSVHAATTTISSDLLAGATSESMTTSTFVFTGNDAYVADLLGVGNDLHVEDDLFVGSNALRFDSAGTINMIGGGLTLDAQGVLSLNTTNNQNVVLGSGNLGVNSSTPAFTLSVSGTGYFSGATRIINDLYVGAASESMTTSTFSLGGNDAFVADLLGVGNDLFVEDDLFVGSNALRFDSGGLINMIGGGLTIDSQGTLSLNTTNNQSVSFGSGSMAFNTSSPAFYFSVNGVSIFSATSTIQDIISRDSITLGGVRRTTWPSSGVGDAVLSANQTWTGNNTFTGWSFFASSTVTGTLNVESGTLYVDATNDRVGIGTTTPDYTLSVSGTSYFAGTTTLGDALDAQGRLRSPQSIGSLNFSGNIYGIRIVGEYAYVIADNSRFHVVKIASSTNMSILATLVESGSMVMTTPIDLDIQGNYAYVVSRDGLKGLQIIDISDPTSPRPVGALANGTDSANLDQPRGIDVVGNYAYIAVETGNALEIVDISDPKKPRHVTAFTDASIARPQDVVVSGNYAFLVSHLNNSILMSVDISNPLKPFVADTYVDTSLWSYPNFARLFLAGNYLYVGAETSQSVNIFDISNPKDMLHVGRVTDSTKLAREADIFVSGDYAFVGSYTGVASYFFTIVEISNRSAPRIVGSLPLSGSFPPTVWGSGKYVYVGAGANLNIIDVGGAYIGQADIGTAEITNLHVRGTAYYTNGAMIRGGAGISGGLAIDGGSFAMANTSSYNFATNTLDFSHAALFRSNATSAAPLVANMFIFDTQNDFPHAASSTYLMSVRNNGRKAFSVASNGDVAASGTLFAANAFIGTPGSPGDLAERVDIAVDDMVEPGDVVIVDPENTDTYRRSRVSYEQSVAGVISTNPTLVIGYGQTQHTAVLAMVGRVPIKVSTENGPIRRGDILVTASTTGYAMRYDSSKDDENRVVGIIGVALQSLPDGQGKIMSLVRTGWVNNRHKTIADIQQELLELAEAQNAEQNNPQVFNVVEKNGAITFLADDLNANGKSIFNIGRLAGKDNLWEVDEQGRFVTRLATSEGEKSLYSLQSAETEYVFSGSAQLQEGAARVDFSPVTKEIIDGQKPMKINITLTSEALGVYISGKDAMGFVVKELQGGKSNAAFDYVVIAQRKGKQQNNEAVLPKAENPQVNPAEPPVQPPAQEAVKPAENNEVKKEEEKPVGNPVPEDKKEPPVEEQPQREAGLPVAEAEPKEEASPAAPAPQDPAEDQPAPEPDAPPEP